MFTGAAKLMASVVPVQDAFPVCSAASSRAGRLCNSHCAPSGPPRLGSGSRIGFVFGIGASGGNAP